MSDFLNPVEEQEENNELPFLGEIKDLIPEAEEDARKFYEKGNKSAAVRARKALQEIRNLSFEMRKDIQEKKKAQG